MTSTAGLRPSVDYNGTDLRVNYEHSHRNRAAPSEFPVWKIGTVRSSSAVCWSTEVIRKEMLWLWWGGEVKVPSPSLYLSRPAQGYRPPLPP